MLNRLCQVMTSANRLALPQLVEQGGTLLWNASLPLLQHNLRHTLTQPLTQLTHYMEKEERWGIWECVCEVVSVCSGV